MFRIILCVTERVEYLRVAAHNLRTTPGRRRGAEKRPGRREEAGFLRTTPLAAAGEAHATRGEEKEGPSTDAVVSPAARAFCAAAAICCCFRATALIPSSRVMAPISVHDLGFRSQHS